MALISLNRRTSLVIAIDLQERLTKSIHAETDLLRRCEYLLRVAKALEIPILATTQNEDRLGPLHPALPWDGVEVMDKLSFSCWKDPGFKDRVKEAEKDQIVILGAETHICVCLTANDLLEYGYEVVVCPDAVSSSTVERHKLGMERIRDAGAVPAHTESVAYEWTSTAADPQFIAVLQLTKEFH